jgi:hypothetical protein
MSTEGKFAANTLNTILLAIALGLLSWIGITAQATSEKVAVLSEKSATSDRELLDLRARVGAVEIQLAQLRRDDRDTVR